MDERVMQFRVGVMVLASFLITLILVLMLGRMPSLWGSGYTVNIVFGDAAGVIEGTPVTKRGVLIGRVVGRPRLVDDRGVEITVRIDNGQTLYETDVPRIDYSMYGSARIDFSPNGARSSSTATSSPTRQ